MAARRQIPALLLALGACAHGPQAGGPSTAGAIAGPELAWPAPPDSPRLRWAGTFPQENAAPASVLPWWRRAVNAVAGIEEAAAGRDLLRRPFGLAVDGESLLVADPDAAMVLAVDWRKGTASPVTCGVRSWVAPMAVAVAPDRTRYVADGGGVVARLPASGTCTLLGEGRLERPSGVAFLDGRVWAVDPPRHDVVAFTPDGREVLRLGGRGDEPGKLQFPSALAAAPDGTLLVVDALNFRVSRFSPDGRHLGSFGQPGETETDFGRPKAIAVDGAGGIFVTDAQADQVKVFGADGRFQFAAGVPGARAGGLAQPSGVAVGGGYLFVADSLNRRVAVFEVVGEAS